MKCRCPLAAKVSQGRAPFKGFAQQADVFSQHELHNKRSIVSVGCFLFPNNKNIIFDENAQTGFPAMAIFKKKKMVLPFFFCVGINER